MVFFVYKRGDRMKQEKIKMTQDGYENIKKELLKLYQETRPQIIEQLKIAYEFGDLRENSEFDSAKDAQNLCDLKIKRLENLLKNAIIIKENEKNQVNIGSIVTIRYLEDQEEETYQLVGVTETSSSINKISNVSPMGKALCGAKKGDIISITSPNGEYKVEITKIE